MRTNKELLKTLALISDHGQFRLIDTIDYENNWWLVFDWIDNITQKWSKPKRIVKLNSLSYIKMDDGLPYDFTLNGEVSISLFSAPIQNLPQHVIAIDNPDILVPLQIE